MSVKARHIAVVEPYLGSGAYGDTYGPPFNLPCVYEGVRQLVRGSDGSEAVSEGRLFADPVDVPAGSKVTILGRQTWVITVSTFDGSRDAHIQVALA